MYRVGILGLLMTLVPGLALVLLSTWREGWRGFRTRRVASRLREVGDRDRRRAVRILGEVSDDPRRLEPMLKRFREAAGPGLDGWSALELETLTAPGAFADARHRSLLGHLALLPEAPRPAPAFFLALCLLDEDPRLCGAAALAVGGRPEHYPGAAIPLVTALRQAPPRSAAAVAWGLERVLASHPELVAELGADPSSAVRQVALRAAATTLADGKLSLELEAALRKQVEQACGDTEPAVRKLAFEAMARMVPRHLGLIEAAVGDASEDVAFAAARALSSSGHGAAQVLIRALAGAPAALRAEALAALSDLRPPFAVEIRSRLAELDATALAWALEVLGALGGNENAEALLGHLGDDRVETRAAAARGLSRLMAGGEEMRVLWPEILACFREESDPGVLVALAECLAGSGTSSASDAILERLTAVPESVRARLLEILARFELFA